MVVGWNILISGTTTSWNNYFEEPLMQACSSRVGYRFRVLGCRVWGGHTLQVVGYGGWEIMRNFHIKRQTKTYFRIKRKNKHISVHTAAFPPQTKSVGYRCWECRVQVLVRSRILQVVGYRPLTCRSIPYTLEQAWLMASSTRNNDYVLKTVVYLWFSPAMTGTRWWLKPATLPTIG